MQSKNLRKPGWLLVIISILFTGFTAVYMLIQHNREDPAHVADQIEEITNKRWVLLQEKTLLLAQQLGKLSEPGILTFDAHAFQGDDMCFMVRKNGNFIFWTDNLIPFDNVATDSSKSRLVQLDNGWYQMFQIGQDSLTIVGLSLIRNQYPYENEYLTNSYQQDYRLKIAPDINDRVGEYNVKDEEGKFIFSLDFITENVSPESHGRMAFPLAMGSWLLINLLLLFLHRRLNPFPSRPALAILTFSLDAIILRGLVHYFSFPAYLHQTPLFNPQYYASSLLNRSLGDLFLNGLTMLVIAFAFFRYVKKSNPNIPVRRKPLVAALLFLLIPTILYGFLTLIRSLILDATVTYDFSNLGSLDQYSFTGLVTMFILATALLLLLEGLMQIIRNLSDRPAGFLASAAPALLVSVAGCFIWQEPASNALLLMFLLWTGGHFISLFGRMSLANRGIWALMVVTVGLTWLINAYGERKEKERHVMIADRYAQKDDPMAEYLFAQVRDQMYKDTLLAGMLFHDSINEDLTISYMLQKYFHAGEKYWSKFNFQITLCNEGQKLSIESGSEVIDCFSFFENQMVEMGSITMTPGFALIHDPLGQTNYLGTLRFENEVFPETQVKKVFIEIFPKVVPADIGYLELMVDKSLKDESGLNQYTNARYYEGQLMASYGKYVYSIDLSNYPQPEKGHFFFSKGGYSHLYYPTGNKSVLLVSSPEKDVLDRIAPFSLFLLVFILMYTFAWQIQRLVDRKPFFLTNFQSRLQITLLGVVVVSFIIVGITSIYYIRVLNREKNMGSLKDKARSIRIEVEHKLADKEILDNELKPYIQSLLIKFNDVFATDINLFDAGGNLLASSRQRLFDEGLISKKINTAAYREMALHKKTLLIHEEHIGKLTYLSAYIPFKNNQNKIIAYINLPYFARQSELSNEISSFLMAFLNIYLLLIAITILFAFFISDMIAKPLVLIREKIQQVKLGSKNDKIIWHKKDEIGELVDEYNRMIDELERSANLLAKSERESAWREMAKQVAHEIKNPLTPMKLNLQHLEKTLAEGNPAWEGQFKRYAKMMHQQIESLASIATAFSDFANMPRGTLTAINLKEAVREAATLFESYPEVILKMNFSHQENALVQGDPEQLNRLLINLLGNAVQARVPEKQLTVTLTLDGRENWWILGIHDNGRGIEDDIREKIFLPSFTTKTSGTGLGLAIAKSIAESMHGTIEFTSKPQQGTTFTITLPKFF